jgi:hypothetical protein
VYKKALVFIVPKVTFIYLYETKRLRIMSLENNEVLKTYEVKESQDKRIEDVAWWERKKKKEVVQELLAIGLETKKDVPCKK